MKRLIALVLLAVIATAPATRPVRAQDTNKAVSITANPVVLGIGEMGTWVATRQGDWGEGTLSIYIVGTVAEPTYTTLFDDGVAACTEYHTRQSYRLECQTSAATDMLVVHARLVIAGSLLHSVACADDLADTYLADDYQIVAGAHRYYLPMLAH